MREISYSESRESIWKLTHWGRNDMVPTLQNSLFKFVTRGLVDKKLPLVEIMASRRTGAEPLAQPMVTMLTVAFMQKTSSLQLCY